MQQAPGTDHDDAVWDPERLREVGTIVTRYAGHLQEGDRIRLGLEGDPCTPYRSSEDAPRATVTSLRRDAVTGDVRFTAVEDGTGATLELDNRNVAPGRVWEIDPNFAATFRGRVHAAAEAEEADEGMDDDRDGQESSSRDRAFAGSADSPERADAAASSGGRHVQEEEEAEYRSSVDARLSRMQTQLEEHARESRAFRETMLSTVRALAGDLMRGTRGEALQFSDQYADRYDLAVVERAHEHATAVPERDDDDHDRAAADGFRAAGARQREKYDFHDDFSDAGSPPSPPPSSPRRVDAGSADFRAAVFTHQAEDHDALSEEDEP